MKQIKITNTLKLIPRENGGVLMPDVKYEFSPDMDLYDASYCLNSLILAAAERLRDIDTLIGRRAGKGA